MHPDFSLCSEAQALTNHFLQESHRVITSKQSCWVTGQGQDMSWTDNQLKSRDTNDSWVLVQSPVQPEEDLHCNPACT
jgi:hypothetical protein